jgi:hypothetical protein
MAETMVGIPIGIPIGIPTEISVEDSSHKSSQYRMGNYDWRVSNNRVTGSSEELAGHPTKVLSSGVGGGGGCDVTNRGF